jgi:hypothetical protein
MQLLITGFVILKGTDFLIFQYSDQERNLFAMKKGMIFIKNTFLLILFWDLKHVAATDILKEELVYFSSDV